MNLSSKPLETVREVPAARRSIRPPPVSSSSTGFFLSMDEVEKTRSQMEQENQKRQDQRRKFSTNYEAFSVDLSEESSVRRETFYVLPKINHTQSLAPPNQLILDNKENSRGFPSDISGISPSEERVAIQKSMIKSAHGDVLTSTPLQRQNLEK